MAQLVRCNITPRSQPRERRSFNHGANVASTADEWADDKARAAL
jgi:hypothetical protein